MLTRMTEQDWVVALEAFRAARSRRGDEGRDDRRFLEALHSFAVHNVTWRALLAEFGNWNSVWKRFWRLSRTGTFEAFFQALAGLSRTAHLVASRADVRQHHHPCACLGGRGKGGQQGQALGRSRGGFGAKIHLKCDFEGLPLDFHLTGGEASDSRQFETLLDIGPDVTPRAVMADKGSDAQDLPLVHELVRLRNGRGAPEPDPFAAVRVVIDAVMARPAEPAERAEP